MPDKGTGAATDLLRRTNFCVILRHSIRFQEASTPDTESLIRERAYAIWELTGRPLGRDMDHWFQAAKEVAVAIPPPGAVTKLRQAAKAAAKTPTKERA